MHHGGQVPKDRMERGSAHEEPGDEGQSEPLGGGGLVLREDILETLDQFIRQMTSDREVDHGRKEERRQQPHMPKLVKYQRYQEKFEHKATSDRCKRASPPKS